MHVSAIDHVNILTYDIDGTATFYERLLGLRRGESPANKMGRQGAWMFDAADNPIIHLSHKDPARDYGAGHEPGEKTAAVHHVAFRCEDFASACKLLDEMGTEYGTNAFLDSPVRQILLTDPNNVNLELNFAAG